MKKEVIFKSKIGIIGGSGFYKLLDDVKEVETKTPFGKPSSKLMLGKYKNREVVFLPRHGKNHELPPHKIPYKANLWAMKELGVKKILAPCACGSLQPDIKPGDFVIVDQFVNKTYGRDDTYFHGPDVMHISSAEPYCSSLRQEIYQVSKRLKITAHFGGIVVIINGPRFSSKAESKFYSQQGWEVINMTNYPECVLARELEMCYAAICLVTDYDAAIFQKNERAVQFVDVARVFKENNIKIKELILKVITDLEIERKCICHEATKNAKV